MGLLPFRLNKTEPVAIGSEIRRIDRLSCLLVHAAERGLLDVHCSLSAVASWDTYPTTIVNVIGPISTKALLERDVGFSMEKLQTIANRLGGILLKDDKTDPYQVLKHLEELKANNPRSLVRKYAETLQVDTIRSKSDSLSSGLEAITRFIDSF